MRLRLRGRFIILLFPAVRRDDARRESIPSVGWNTNGY